VRIAYSYDPAKTPLLNALLRRFEVSRIEALPNEIQKQLSAFYPDLKMGDEIALIHLEIIERP
jgi:hypothetical protein